MLTPEQQETNQKRFLQLFDKLVEARPGEEEGWAALRAFLMSSDFFTAPASTIFHANYTGGLCEHSLNVYNSLVSLMCMAYGDDQANWKYSWDSIALVSLFHDISKVNNYMWGEKNVKKYYGPDDKVPYNAKRDQGGAFDWVKEYSWMKRPLKESFKFFGHEDDSVLILQKYVYLTNDEIIAILHHTGCVASDSFESSKSYSYCFSNFPLALLLHMADMYACFMLEPSGVNDLT